MPEGAHRHLRELVALLQDVSLHILANLNHEHSVVTLSGQACVSDRKIIAKLVH